MRYKKQIVSVMTLTILLILMMSTAMQAVSLVGNINDFKATMNGSQMKLTWSSVSNSAGYNVYVNGTKIGSVNSNEASLIGFSENTTYRLKVVAYDSNKIEMATSDEIKFTTTMNQTNLGKVQDLTVTQTNGYVTLNWASVKDADKYQVFVDVPGFGNMNIGEVTTTSAILKGFSDGMRYGFSIRACQTLNTDNVSYGQKSDAKYITIDFDKDDTNNDNDNNQTRPDRVTNVTVYDIEQTTATVTWKEVNNVDGYDVLLSKNYGSYQNIASKTGNKVYLSNLTPDSYYRVKIVAYKWNKNEKVYGEESSYSSFTTKQEKIVVGNIDEIDVYDIGTTTARVAWSKANNADGYEVLLSKNNGKYEMLKDTSNRTVTLSNLDDDTTYRVKVVAYKWVNGRKQYGNESYAYRFNTQVEKITVGDVRTIYVDNLTKNSARISWTSVSGAEGYNIYFAQENGRFQYKGSTTNRSYNFSNLKANTYYQVKVEAYKKVNGKEYTSTTPTVKGFTTSKETLVKPATPTQLTATVRNRNEAYLVWWPVEGITGYEVEISKNGGAYKHVKYVAGNNTILTSDMLDYSTNYKVRVRAYKNQYVNGKYETVYSNYSSATSFKTESYNKTENNTSIAKVTGLGGSMKGTTVSLNWNKVNGAAGYEIDLNVPGYGHTKIQSNSNSKTISGITGKNYDYTARVRAYKYVNGVKTYGPYSDVVKFKER
ncbi:MAG: hypothetical protein HFJ30_10170 [Clostridia bacterium]|nr:hypothetical protein [Clostridia bacterium]MCI9413231.1 hypothetical protein [Clostridia bacterium]